MYFCLCIYHINIRQVYDPCFLCGDICVMFRSHSFHYQIFLSGIQSRERSAAACYFCFCYYRITLMIVCTFIIFINNILGAGNKRSGITVFFFHYQRHFLLYVAEGDLLFQFNFIFVLAFAAHTFCKIKGTVCSKAISVYSDGCPRSAVDILIACLVFKYFIVCHRRFHQIIIPVAAGACSWKICDSNGTACTDLIGIRIILHIVSAASFSIIQVKVCGPCVYRCHSGSRSMIEVLGDLNTSVSVIIHINGTGIAAAAAQIIFQRKRFCIYCTSIRRGQHSFIRSSMPASRKLLCEAISNRSYSVILVDRKSYFQSSGYSQPHIFSVFYRAPGFI